MDRKEQIDMSTLKENFRNLFKNHFQKGKEEELLLNAVDADLEKIADDYAIEFSKWIRLNAFEVVKGWMIEDEFYTDKELLKEFKKQKGY